MEREVHYHVHKILPLSQMNLVHSFISLFLEWFNPQFPY